MTNVYRIIQSVGPPADGGGEPPMEARIARLEADVDHIKRDISDIKGDLRDVKKDAREDFRILWGSLIATALCLAGLMAKGFHWI